MALEASLIAALKTVCPEVHMVEAKYGTPMPYVTWQHIGGRSQRYADNEAADTRNALIQINTWAKTGNQAHALILQIEEALCRSSDLQVTPHGAPQVAYDDADIAKGYLQTHSITGAR